MEASSDAVSHEQGICGPLLPLSSGRQRDFGTLSLLSAAMGMCSVLPWETLPGIWFLALSQQRESGLWKQCVPVPAYYGPCTRREVNIEVEE